MAPRDSWAWVERFTVQSVSDSLTSAMALICGKFRAEPTSAAAAESATEPSTVPRFSSISRRRSVSIRWMTRACCACAQDTRAASCLKMGTASAAETESAWTNSRLPRKPGPGVVSVGACAGGVSSAGSGAVLVVSVTVKVSRKVAKPETSGQSGPLSLSVLLSGLMGLALRPARGTLSVGPHIVEKRSWGMDLSSLGEGQ